MAIQTPAKQTSNHLTIDKKDPKIQVKTDSMPPKSKKNENNGQDERVVEINPLYIVGIIVAAIVIIGAVFLLTRPQDTKKQPETLQDSLISTTAPLDGFKKGDPKAPLTIIEFSDFECIFCRMHVTGIDPRTGIKSPQSVFSQLEENYINKGKVQYVFQPYSGVPSHSPAYVNDTVAALCAADQGKFWEYHDKLFESSQGDGLGVDRKGSEQSALKKIATDLGLDGAKFDDCYGKRNTTKINTIRDYVNNKIAPEFEKANVTIGTPVFLICKTPTDAGATECKGRAFAGAESFENFKLIMDFVSNEGSSK